MNLEMEWRVPWPADWTDEKRVKAAEKLVEYIQQGTMYETKRRMQVTNAQIQRDSRADEPYLSFRLES